QNPHSGLPLLRRRGRHRVCRQAPTRFEYFAASYRTTPLRRPYRTQAIASHLVATRSSLAPQCLFWYCPGVSSRSCSEETETACFQAAIGGRVRLATLD